MNPTSGTFTQARTATAAPGPGSNPISRPEQHRPERVGQRVVDPDPEQVGVAQQEAEAPLVPHALHAARGLRQNVRLPAGTSSGCHAVQREPGQQPVAHLARRRGCRSTQAFSDVDEPRCPASRLHAHGNSAARPAASYRAGGYGPSCPVACATVLNPRIVARMNTSARPDWNISVASSRVFSAVICGLGGEPPRRDLMQRPEVADDA